MAIETSISIVHPKQIYHYGGSCVLLVFVVLERGCLTLMVILLIWQRNSNIMLRRKQKKRSQFIGGLTFLMHDFFLQVFLPRVMQVFEWHKSINSRFSLSITITVAVKTM